MCRLAIGYQDAAAECEIVRWRAPLNGYGITEEVAEQLATDSVALTRGTRSHTAIRQGSSVRGAIDLALVCGELLKIRGITETGSGGRIGDGGATSSAVTASPRARYATTVYDAMVVALSGRIYLDEALDTTPEEVLREVWEDYYVLDPAAADPG